MPDNNSRRAYETRLVQYYMAAAAKPWRDRYVTLREAGTSLPAIAVEMQMKLSHVEFLRQALRKLGIKTRKPPPKGRKDIPTGYSLRAKIGEMAAEGLSNQGIAISLSISIRTVRKHRQILDGRHVESRPIIRPYFLPDEAEAAPDAPQSTGCAYPVFRGRCTAARAPGSPYCVEHGRPVYRLSRDIVCAAVPA